MFGTMNCTYETPCGWCTKWDKKCDRKIGCDSPSTREPKTKKIENCLNCKYYKKPDRAEYTQLCHCMHPNKDGIYTPKYAVCADYESNELENEYDT